MKQRTGNLGLKAYLKLNCLSIKEALQTKYFFKSQN